MLPRSRRISRTLFPTLLESRQFAHSSHLSLRFTPADKTARMAVSVSKKVAKSAVVRNTLRRRLYAALRPRLDDLPHGLYLYVAKTGAEKLKGERLDAELTLLLKGLKKS